MLTFDPQCKLITDGFTFGIKSTAGVVSTRITCNLLKHQTLIWSNYTSRCIMRQMNALRMRIWTIKNFCLPDVTAAASFYEFSGILCIFYERRKGNFKTKTKGDFHFFLCLSSREKSSRLQINAKSHFYLQFDFYGIFFSSRFILHSDPH